MTMDINNGKTEIKADVFLMKSEEQTEVPVKTKRSFDVAFLMLPDEKLKQKQNKLQKFTSNYEVEISSRNENNNSPVQTNSDEDEEIEVDTPKIDFSKLQNTKYFTQKQQIFGDPHLGKPKQLENEYRAKVTLNSSSPEQKSAFTKVSLASKESRLSPNLSISPDLSYQNSLSPSPPIINRNYQNFHQSMLSPNQLFKAQNVPAYQNNFIHENFTGHSQLESPFILKSPNAAELMQPNFSKLRPMLTQYRPDLSTYNYTQFQQQEMLKISQPEMKFTPEIRNPAAAILSSLLPPSLAALSLPAQNVCAKCNISFRMTSDLVYHMRSHHKNDTADYSKRKREEKLKCPVCAESFRERHHLTRHMTAHQDKDNDGDEPENKKKVFLPFGK
ncbi:PREDICTED: uncharacterized protein LOC108565353 [Nicrophorus vespilloides]|uniref:Uncharacterized protein LOC108565353 n=1 Tax=Nicrophorus vespilloides TaxID=110193 RepID=A0ABM1N0B2_NICVS|nr:PREDICTED: uncharacterized protein LOC108565353 [Nicrophorus vespilloides]